MGDLYQQIESLTGSLQEKASLNPVRRLIKIFSQYLNLQQQLPPQNLMPYCLFQLPAVFNRLLHIEAGQVPTTQPQLKVSLQLQLYLTSVYKLLQGSSEPDIQFVVLEGMMKSYHLVMAYRKVLRQWVKLLVEIWATGEIKVKVRAFAVLNRIVGAFGMDGDEEYAKEQATWLLRRMYVRFVENAKHVTWRNYEYLNLMINCYCEMCRTRPDIAYFVVFGYIRMMAVQIEKALKESKTKKKELMKKLYSFEILNCLRLLTAVVTRVSTQQLSALIYPLVQVLESYCRLNSSTDFLPLKLHLLDLFLQTTQKTSVFIPYTLTLVCELLQCRDFSQHKPKTAQSTPTDLFLIYQISPANRKSTTFWSQLFGQILKKLIRCCCVFTRIIGGVELLGVVRRILKRECKEVKYAGYKIMIKKVLGEVNRDMEVLQAVRAAMKKLTPAKGVDKYERELDGVQLELRATYQNNEEEELRLLKQKLQAQLGGGEVKQDEEQPAEEAEDSYLEGEEQEQVSGASSYEPSEKQSSKSEEKEDVSYDGDPDNVQQLMKQWSEHEWSSQNQL